MRYICIAAYSYLCTSASPSDGSFQLSTRGAFPHLRDPSQLTDLAIPEVMGGIFAGNILHKWVMFSTGDSPFGCWNSSWFKFPKWKNADMVQQNMGLWNSQNHVLGEIMILSSQRLIKNYQPNGQRFLGTLRAIWWLKRGNPWSSREHCLFSGRSVT